MLAEIHSGALTGIEAYAVSIEVNAGHGEPKTVVVGLPDAAVKESADRVWTALLHSGFEPPKGRTTINLAPANRRKEGPCFDLPIALGILAATDGLRLEGLNRICVVGELALSGAVRPVRGVLPLTLMARAKGFTAVMVPAENAEEAAVVQGIKVFAVRTLRTAADFLNRTLELEPFTVDVKERFLDELPEFQRHVLEVMRQPMEEGWVQLVRAGVSVVYPCRFMLVAAMNPCPCGFLSDPLKVCRCSPRQIERYRGKISGPLLDRIDLQLEVPPGPFETLREMAPGERSALIRARVVAARERQRIRFERVPGVFCNAQMPSRLMASVCRMEPEAEGLLRAAMQELQLSARAYNRILKVARTVADLAEAQWIGSDHVAEAVGYRSLDRPLS
jgi:predicted ATPase with chaperone activity